MNYEIIFDIIRAYISRNKIILTQQNNKIVPKTVNLHWWNKGTKLQNVGDFISPAVVNYMKKINDICDDHVGRTKHLYAIGSIIDGGYQNATVWGSGIHRGQSSFWWNKFRELDIRCVRGPETRKILIQNGYKCPEVYGDPAILMPLVYQPANLKKEYKYVVVPHFSEINEDMTNVVSPLVIDYRDFIDKIVKSELVISSSLHGVILAETYGVPAILLKHNLSMFKYYDYYHSTGRTNIPLASTIDEALNMPIPDVPDLSKLKNNLIDSFPVDLWDIDIL